jgi:DNA-binding transcriptional ArsR family regulator
MSQPSETLSLIADETRAAILRELAAYLHEEGEPPTFSTLRERVGVADSGQFNYHLDQLQDTLVRTDGEGYVLTPFGMRVVGLLFAGVLSGGQGGPVHYPPDCRVCGADQTTEHLGGVIEVSCEEGHTETHFVPPAALSSRDLIQATDLARHLSRQAISLAVDGTCPICGDRVDTRLLHGEDGPEVRSDCETCPAQVVAVPADIVLDHPRVQGFLWDQGVDVRERPWTLEWCRPGNATAVSSDPIKVSVDVTAAGETLTVTLDESASIVDFTRT